MPDMSNKLYEEIIRHAVLNKNLGSADVAMFYYDNQTFLRMGLVETWEIKNT